ncbi:hypothetical protein EV1_029462 [Malus domestica]
MLLDQKDTKAAKEVAKTMATEAYSFAEKIKRLKSELIVDLKTWLDTIQVKHESAVKEIGCYIPQIQDLECIFSELCSATYTKDKELITVYNQVIHFKKIVDRLEPQVLELQGALKINERLKKEVDELQCVCVSLPEENEQLKGENDRLEALLVQSQVNFYKLCYVDYLYGKPSDFEFAGKNFEIFSISLKNMIAFTFEASISKVVKKVGTHVGTAGGEALDDAAAESVAVAEGVAIK